jgi:hypothetical protein
MWPVQRRIINLTRFSPAPVRGDGAFYTPTSGSRYNRLHQRTVSCSEDPIVAITEGALSKYKCHNIKSTTILLWGRLFTWKESELETSNESGKIVLARMIGWPGLATKTVMASDPTSDVRQRSQTLE